MATGTPVGSTALPVPTTATGSTKPVTTSPVCMSSSQWEQHSKISESAHQVEQVDQMFFGSPGSPATQPMDMSGQPFFFSQIAWPGLPVSLGQN